MFYKTKLWLSTSPATSGGAVAGVLCSSKRETLEHCPPHPRLLRETLPQALFIYDCVSKCCGDAGGTWTNTYGFDPSAVNAEFVCAYNRVQQWLTAAGANVSVGSVSNMQANMAVLYQLLLDLTTGAHGIAYVDPNEPSSPGSEPCRSDVSFRKETQDCKKGKLEIGRAHVWTPVT